MKIKVKKLRENAILPKYASEGAACLDLHVSSIKYNEDKTKITYGCGYAFEIPWGFEGNLKSRSSVHGANLILSNGVGTIDSDYRGEIKAVFWIVQKDIEPYKIGERFAQINITKCEPLDLCEVEKLSETKRGTKGYGHTGK